jgi:hypothetical protein
VVEEEEAAPAISAAEVPTTEQAAPKEGEPAPAEGDKAKAGEKPKAADKPAAADKGEKKEKK